VLLDLTPDTVLAILGEGPDGDGFRPDLFAKLCRRDQLSMRYDLERCGTHPEDAMTCAWMDRVMAEQDGRLN
jgi:hypothetical protein